MDETMQDGAPEVEHEDSDTGTAYLPASVAGPSCKPGATITLKVVSVDEEDGTVEVAPASSSTPADGAEDPNESLDRLNDE